MSEAFESKRAPEPDDTFLHAKRVAELLVFSGCRCNQLDRGLKETV
jgi:hypothetical protein